MRALAAILPPLAGRTRLLPWLTHALARRRQRAHLLRLDDHLLRDIGLTRADVLDEAARPFWDVPRHWRGRD